MPQHFKLLQAEQFLIEGYSLQGTPLLEQNEITAYKI